MQLRSVLAFNKAFLKNMYVPSTMVQGTDVGTYVTDSQGGSFDTVQQTEPWEHGWTLCPAQGVKKAVREGITTKWGAKGRPVRAQAGHLDRELDLWMKKWRRQMKLQAQ